VCLDVDLAQVAGVIGEVIIIEVIKMDFRRGHHRAPSPR
jgi:hypothetical protein